jgi:hypothetical protein
MKVQLNGCAQPLELRFNLLGLSKGVILML